VTVDVDLSFYDATWYDIITRGSDADSCFNTGNTPKEELPARRDNLKNAFLEAGTQWSYGFFEGEDFCNDPWDFTVDFNDRGVDGDQTDGTDWGEDDSFKKCGTVEYSYWDSTPTLYSQIWIR
jgi:hypothetical protein